jgi:hypothetical protein
MRKRSKGRMYRRSLLVARPLALFGLAAPASAAEHYGLVVGIDDCLGTENDLDGAVNDAKDVANALNEAGAKEVARLLNGDASKDRIVAAWERIAGEGERRRHDRLRLRRTRRTGAGATGILSSTAIELRVK